MRHLQLFAALAVTSLLAAGCGGGAGTAGSGGGAGIAQGGSGGDAGGSGGDAGGSGGDGGSGGSAPGCTGVAPRCANLDNCECVAATCDVDTWICDDNDHPTEVDACPKKSDCEFDSGPYGDCSTPKGDLARGTGACCQVDTDCVNAKQPNALCLNGFCSSICATSDDCGPLATPTPFAEGTTLYCQPTNLFGAAVAGLCIPGSGAACNGPKDCSAAEICGTTWANFDSGNLVGGMETHCVARVAVAGVKDYGDTCSPVGAGPYQCARPDMGVVQGTRFQPSPCNFGRCDASCNPDMPACNDGETCAALAIPITGATLTGAGVCSPPVCGSIDPTTATFDIGSCPDGAFCGPGPGTGPSTLALVCQPEEPTGVPFAGPCQLDPVLGKVCQDTTLCHLKAGYIEDATGTACSTSAECSGQSCLESDGDGQAHCSNPPPDGICTKLCGNDHDCGGNLPSCLLVSQGPGLVAPECTTKQDAYPASLACSKETDCKGLGQGCLQGAPGTALTICAVANPDLGGMPCHTDANCAKGNVCATGSDGQPHCTAVGSLQPEGKACDKNTVCRSGVCLDSANGVPTSGANDICGGPCRFTADCAAGLACKPRLTQGTGTADPADDFDIGFCMPEGPALLSQVCKATADCGGAGYDCDLDSGRCFYGTAKVGQSCSNSINCPLHSECMDGACVQWGCNPADRLPCPNAATCVAKGPVSVCIRM